MEPGRNEIEAGLLHFRIKQASTPFANGVAGQIDLAQDSTRRYALGDTKKHVPVGQELHRIRCIPLCRAYVVIPNGIGIPVDEKALENVRAGRKNVYELNA